MKVTFSLPALKLTPSSINLGSVAQGNSIKSLIKIENLSTRTVFSLQVGKILNSECFLLQ